MSLTDDIKQLLSGTPEERLDIIVRRTRERLWVILGISQDYIPQELEYIVMEVALKRFNRIGQEGMQSYSQEGLSMTFAESDFEEYASEIEAWQKSNEEESNKKIGRFRLY
ncbi:phage head-tail connector protein [Lactococcus muris]|uniref:Phage head-tail connector protein n=1 Tax=Lactococcus muris TaxID=2941330 RepID=A0ABV4DFE5_9LACT